MLRFFERLMVETALRLNTYQRRRESRRLALSMARLYQIDSDWLRLAPR